MIDGKKILSIIPARGGSKGIKRKNIRDVGGKPLIAWTIDAAAKSRYIDRVVLSSDDEEIIEVARRYGCEVPFLRPSELSGDDTPGIAPVLHALDNLSGYDVVVLLQPTSPLRTSADIDGAIDFWAKQKAPACVSVSPSAKSPFWMYTLDTNAKLHPLIKKELILRRQDLPDTMVLNGAIYVADCGWLRTEKTFLTPETVGFVMPISRSLDIDEEIDLEICDALLSKRIEK
ncbi:MAG: acylneuraminate cytidylyltransferase family protein [Desulfuromonadales bacterium]|nr:acylneuraminate cytidylyltransferase family protein [Desulfuromonadales bacterium]MDW7756469.1 acylneuraminate cytidylyltransferase family protein [Desulfuromonadales bacterium]